MIRATLLAALCTIVGCMLEDDPLFGVSAGGTTDDDATTGSPTSSGTSEADVDSATPAGATTSTSESSEGADETTAAVVDGSTTADAGSSSESTGPVAMQCDNGIREGTEACDGADFGGETCQSRFGASFDGGTLQCIDCMIIDTACCVNQGGACSTAADCCNPLQQTCTASGVCML